MKSNIECFRCKQNFYGGNCQYFMEDLDYGGLYSQMDLSDYTVPGMFDLQYEIKGQADRIINVCTNF